MKKLLILLALIFSTLASIAQETRCTDVLYVSLYKWDNSKNTFVHSSTRASDLTYCMSENHLQVDNQVETFIFLNKALKKFEKPGHTEYSYNGIDKNGKNYTVVYIFKDNVPYHMKVQAIIYDWAAELRVEYYLKPY